MLNVGTFAPFTYGKSLLKKVRNETGGVPVFGSNGIIGYHDKPLTNGPTIIIGRKGTVGAVHYSPVPCWPIDTTFYITDQNIPRLRFKYYLLKSLGLSLMNSDSAVPGLNRKEAHAITIKVPSEGDQRFISSCLGNLDDKIELNRRMNENLEEMARALFKSWFVDFDPVRAKMDGRWQPGQSLPGLPAELYDLFPDRFVPSELGEIPKGWQIKPLEYTTTNIKEKENPLESPNVLFYHYSIPAYDKTNLPQIEPGYNIKSTKNIVPPGVILISRLNPDIDRVWLVDVKPGERAICSTEFLVLKPKPPFSVAYIYSLARSTNFRQQIQSLVTGTSRSHQRARVPDVMSLDILVPTDSIIHYFNKISQRLLARTLINRQENSAVSELRDILLPKLLSGEIRVNADWEDDDPRSDQ